MRSTRQMRKDAVATVLVVAAVALYALTESGVDVPGMGSVRMRASAVFLLGVLAFAAGSRPDVFSQRGVVLPIVSVLTVLGLGTLVVGVAAIAGGGHPFLTALVGGIALLWLGATMRHLTSRWGG